MALSLAGGSDIPGTPSTLGRRLGSIPRVGASVSFGAQRVGMPDLTSSAGSTPGDETFTLFGARGNVAIGFLDGIQLAPTVGGVLSLDALANYSIARLPTGAGFDGNVTSFGVGGRLGLLRESFSLPGVSVSAVRRWTSEMSGGDVVEGTWGEFTSDMTVTSYRATIGKNLFALGLMGGVGWDHVDGDVTMRVRLPVEGQGDVEGQARGLHETDRRLFFLSAWFTMLVYQVSAEIGYVEGSDLQPSINHSGFDPSGRQFFGNVAFRITF